jgi:single-strand DNA-binding protein
VLNVSVLVGRLVADPELRYIAAGTPVAKFRMAVDRGYANEQGEKQTDFVDVVVWRAQAENAAKFLSKGRLAGVVGRLQIRSYDDSQGIRRKAAEVIADRVIFLPDGRGRGQGQIEEAPFPDEEPPWMKKGGEPPEEIQFSEEDAPF